MKNILNRGEPSQWEKFTREPCLFLVQWLFSRRRIVLPTPISPVTVVCLSDTHNRQPKIPTGEVLIHAGDLTQSGKQEEVQAALDWLNAQPHRRKIVVAGNHDLFLENGDRGSLNWGGLVYLQDEAHEITCDNGRQLKIYGSPLSPRHGNWAFQYQRTEDVWTGKIPDDVDILITHGPPKGYLDHNSTGCGYLVEELWRVRPLLHVFGHIHIGHGIQYLQFDSFQRAYETTTQVGGGICNL